MDILTDSPAVVAVQAEEGMVGIRKVVEAQQQADLQHHLVSHDEYHGGDDD